MIIENIDLTKYVNNNLVPPPEGVYNVECTRVERYTAKSSRKPMLQFIWMVLDGKFTGRYFTTRIALEGDGPLSVLASLFLTLGVPLQKELDTDPLIGKKCRVVLVKNDSNMLSCDGYMPYEEDSGLL
ncbi:DUF669 domain-containing protein [Desulfatibacillum aliphaticivorans]|uniref:DUF669 domain-containing protein n=1 Tax=Desulfatibacillum aliphaticivorans TaxID=218208 RepID=UPI000417DF3D|nr:DUF669 domain-containing protein [Desulfatibacillum aliphaticivorans]